MTQPLDELEIACGLVLGAGRPAALPRRHTDPAAALEAAFLPALRRGRVFVSFSGGRDSSLVLAAATRAARRGGLQDPVPVSIRVSDTPAADESRWQELAVQHLSLRDWVRLELGDELDAVGPVATAVLRRHGLVWPFNAHFHVPMLEVAKGGTLLTGIGGDELFRGASRHHALAAPLSLRRIALAAAPAPVRRAWRTRRADAGFPWLTDEGRRTLAAALAAQGAGESLRLRARLRWLRGIRYLAAGTATLARLADDAGAAIAHPLVDAAVWSAVGAAAPPRGFADRTAAMRALFAGDLPDELLARADKASFDEVFFRSHSRAFVEGWDGGGVPRRLVDERVLGAHWRSERPLPQSWTLLQAAWLASAGQRVEEPPHRPGQLVPAARAGEAPDRQ